MLRVTVIDVPIVTNSAASIPCSTLNLLIYWYVMDVYLSSPIQQHIRKSFMMIILDGANAIIVMPDHTHFLMAVEL